MCMRVCVDIRMYVWIYGWMDVCVCMFILSFLLPLFFLHLSLLLASPLPSCTQFHIFPSPWNVSPMIPPRQTTLQRLLDLFMDILVHGKRWFSRGIGHGGGKASGSSSRVDIGYNRLYNPQLRFIMWKEIGTFLQKGSWRKWYVVVFRLRCGFWTCLKGVVLRSLLMLHQQGDLLVRPGSFVGGFGTLPVFFFKSSEILAPFVLLICRAVRI